MIISRFQRSILLLVLALLGGTWVLFSRDPVTSSEAFVLTEAPIVGHLAPDFTLPSSLGSPVSLVDHVDRSGEAGRAVVLNFWASWCGPCRIETPELQKASLRYQNQVAILGVNQGESVQTISEYGVSYGLTYPLLVDGDSAVNQLYGVVGLPTTIFIDRAGIVREVFIGILTRASLEEKLKSLIAE